jgi:hypothetical protein
MWTAEKHTCPQSLDKWKTQTRRLPLIHNPPGYYCDPPSFRREGFNRFGSARAEFRSKDRTCESITYVRYQVLLELFINKKALK